jgi:hypothetical protein
MSVYMGTITRYPDQGTKMIPAKYSTSCVEYEFTAGKFTKLQGRLLFKDDQSSVPRRLAACCTLRPRCTLRR